MDTTTFGASDLRFAAPRAAEFLNLVMGMNLTMQEITTLETQTVGWIATLQLAALSKRGRTAA